MTGKIPWGRILAEGTLIVAGVLVGLGIDAWWDNRAATHQAREELAGVLDELEDARTEIERGLAQHRRWAATTSALYEQLLAVERGQPLTVSDTLLSGLLLPIWVTDAPSALLEAFTTSGHVAQLDNPELRRQLLAWVPRLEDLRDDEARLRAFQDSEVRPYLARSVDLAIAWPALVRWMRRGQDVPGLILPDYEAVQHDVELVATLELRNLVAQTETLLVAPMLQSPQALEALQGLADVVRAELP